MNQSTMQRWASRQLADYDTQQPGTLFSEGIVLDVAQGYELQAAVTKLRQQRGEQVIGYKVGCTSAVIRSQLGIEHCITGRLYDSEQHASGAELSLTDFANLAIEGELAVQLSGDPSEHGFSPDKIPTCVGRVFPVIELHNYVIRGEQPSAGELIANNAIHAGFVSGQGIDMDNQSGAASSDTMALSIFIDDRRMDGCEGLALIQTINSSLKWLTETLQQRGDQLRAGQIILTGSIPRLISIDDGCTVRVDAGVFGSVKVEFAA